MTTQTRYFLLITRPGIDVHVEDVGSDEVAAATMYTEREREYGDRPEVEVVLVGADSLETVRKTHSHYFAIDSDDLLADLDHAMVFRRGKRRATVG
jgi:hypothetical protein